MKSIAQFSVFATLVNTILLATLIESCGGQSPSGNGASAGSGGTTTGGHGGHGGEVPTCVDLECQQVTCDNGATTRVTGTVYSPALQSPDPLPNVVLYVPNDVVVPFQPGVACEACGSEISGKPLVLARSAFDGSFTLENVPVGQNIPLVIQSGRWRRQVTIPQVEACVETKLPAELTHLPRNKAQGDIPKMAIQTGRLDALECTLAKLIDVAEMTPPSGDGRVHLYRATGKDMNPPLPLSSQLWSDLDTLKQYDTVLMPCSASSVPYEIPQQGRDNLRSFADVGGRLYITHAGGSWMTTAPEPFPGFIAWNNQKDPASPLSCNVDTTFQKGMTFADWLEHLGVSPIHGQLSLTEPQWYIDSVSPPAQRWVSSSSPVTVQHFTFNTPTSAPAGTQCGRVLFSNYHVVAGGEGLFPSTCPAGDALTTNEKLVEYMLFDVTGCIEPDVPK